MDVSAVAETRSSYDSDQDGLNDSSNATKDGLSTYSVLSNGGSRSSAGTNKFQGAISAWRSKLCTYVPKKRELMALFPDIDLTRLVPGLDNTASEIVSQQRDALLSRKDLAQKTKDFRKLDDEAKLGEFKGLLKGRRSYYGFVVHATKF